MFLLLSEMQITITSVLLVVGLILFCALTLLKRYLPNQLNLNDYWNSHATLNAISKLASQAEVDKKVDVELIYLTGEHVQFMATLVQSKGWLDARQIDSWIVTAVGLHQLTKNNNEIVTRVSVQVCKDIRRMDVRQLTKVILAILERNPLLSFISVIAPRPEIRYFSRFTAYSQVKVHFAFSGPSIAPVSFLKNCINYEETDGSIVIELRMLCE